MSGDRHVVMLVANDVTGDSRVQKTAQSVAAAGYRVTVIGRATDGTKSKEWIGAARIVRVPVPLRLKKASASRDEARKGTRKQGPSDARRRRDARRRDRIALLRARIDAISHRRDPLSRARRGTLWARIRRLQWLMARGRHRHRAGAPATERTRSWRRPPRVDWRTELPTFLDFELAYGPTIEALRPALIHAHDISTLAIGERSAALLRGSGHDVKLVYDAHEWVAGIPGIPSRRLAAYVQLEREHIRGADAVVTVSPEIAQRLQRDHDLRETPAVVLNAPRADGFDPTSPTSVRTATGLSEDVPLLVYSGTVKPQRGLGTLIDALPLLPESHCAIVARSATHPDVVDVLGQAERLGCRNRVHVVPYVAPNDVPSYLRDCDVGVHPLLPSGNADLALPNKLFEYLHAMLPVVATELPAMSAFIHEHGVGETFAAEDPEDLARAVASVLADPERYRRHTRHPPLRDEYSWERQEEQLLATYRELLGDDPRDAPETERPRVAIASVRERERWLVAFAGIDGVEWSQFGEPRGDASLPDGNRAPGTDSGLEPIATLQELLTRYSHILAVGGRSILGSLNGDYFDDDVPLLERHGVRVAPLVRSTDLIGAPANGRGPTDIDRAFAEGLTERLRRYEGTVFAADVGVLGVVKGARYLPVPLDLQPPGSVNGALPEKPRVAYALESTYGESVGRTCRELERLGLIDAIPLGDEGDAGLAGKRVDILVDDLGDGGYSGAAVAAFGRGTLVVGQLAAAVRNRLAVQPPLVHTDPIELRSTLERIVREPHAYMAVAALGPRYVRTVHGSDAVDRTLSRFLTTR